MAWIKTISDDEATGPLAKIFGAAKERVGFVAEVLRVCSLHPTALQGYLKFYQAVMFGDSPLSRGQREMIATVTSQVNSCHY